MLRRNFQNEPRVVVPEVVTELVTAAGAGAGVRGGHADRPAARAAGLGRARAPALVETIVDAYIKMMLEDGVFHADPMPGNLLVDPQGRLVLLDFGMVLQVERETRRRLVETVLAAARQDVDGVINGFYELGILDPDVDRGTVRDAAQSLMARLAQGRRLAAADPAAGRAGPADTFYEWPLMLPSNLVYFGRAGVLVEGIGLRYDPNFNALAMARPVLARSAKRLMQGRARAGSADPGHRLDPGGARPSRGPFATSCAGSSGTSSGSAGTRATPSSSSGSWPSRCGGRCWPSSRSPSRSSRASSTWRRGGSRCSSSGC